MCGTKYAFIKTAAILHITRYTVSAHKDHLKEKSRTSTRAGGHYKQVIYCKSLKYSGNNKIAIIALCPYAL